MGLIEVSIASDENDAWPDEVKSNFYEKIDAVAEALHGQILEFMQFGQAFDEDS